MARDVTLIPVLPALAEMPERAQPKWRAWRTRVNRQKELPESFAEVLNSVACFSDPVLKGTTKGIWDVAGQSWGAGGDLHSMSVDVLGERASKL